MTVAALIAIVVIQLGLILFLIGLCYRYDVLIGDGQSAWLQKLSDFNKAYDERLNDLRRDFFLMHYSEDKDNDNRRTAV